MPEFDDPIELNPDSSLAGKVCPHLSRRDFLNMVLIGSLAAAASRCDALGIKLPPPEGTQTNPTKVVPSHRVNLKIESGNEQTYDSVRDAFAAIQQECLVLPERPVSEDEWVNIVYQFLDDHPEIDFRRGTGGWGGASSKLDGNGYCEIMVLPIKGDSTINGGVLIWEAKDKVNGSRIEYVRFKGSHYQSIYPPPEEKQ